MKTRNILITLTVAACAAVNLTATAALFSPRGGEQQTKTIPAYSDDVNLAAPRLESASPRVLDNQVKTVPVKSAAKAESMNCARHMSGSPKEIGACAEHPGAAMPCCSVAGAK
jgi:hypothetical protein